MEPEGSWHLVSRQKGEYEADADCAGDRRQRLFPDGSLELLLDVAGLFLYVFYDVLGLPLQVTGLALGNSLDLVDLVIAQAGQGCGDGLEIALQLGNLIFELGLANLGARPAGLRSGARSEVVAM